MFIQKSNKLLKQPFKNPLFLEQPLKGQQLLLVFKLHLQLLHSQKYPVITNPLDGVG